MTRPIIVAQISDTHIMAPGALAYGVVDTAAALARCVDTLNGLSPIPDLVVISGDLVDHGTDEEYAHLKALLAPLRIPIVSVPGNHDAREPMRRAFPLDYANGEGALDQAIALGNLDLYLLDSSVAGQPHGALEETTLAWLDAELGRSDNRPALIVLHHPPFLAGIWHMDCQNLRNANELAEIVRQHPRVRLIVSGHIHRTTLTRFAGVPTTVCPAPCHVVALDLDRSLFPAFVLEPPAFHLHVVLPGSHEIVTHTVPVGQFGSPLPFFGPDGELL
jgi:3',5'-cyclic AMP phosphodiesterase CpdA